MVTKRIALSPQARTAIVVAVGWFTGAVLVLAVAFAWGPFASNPPVVCAGVGLAALVHATAAALFVRWGFELGLWAVVPARRRVLTVVMLVVASLATVAVVRFDRLILTELTGGYAAGYRAAIAVGVVAGAAFEAAYLAPRRVAAPRAERLRQRPAAGGPG